MKILPHIAAFFILALPALAAEQFVPIVPIPNSTGGGIVTDRGLTYYINTIFEYTLIAGAALAAIYIAIGGFEYIISESTEAKRDGRARITHALFGLAILLLVTIILYIINPDAICLEIFNNKGVCPTTR